MDTFFEALPSILSGITLLAIGVIGNKAKKISDDFNKFKEEHQELLTIKEDYKDFRESQEQELKDYREQSQIDLANYKEAHHREFLEYQKRVNASIENIQKQQKIFNDSQRTQLKAQIVDIYQQAKNRGYITPMELDIVNKLGENYFELRGNTYIGAVIKRCNEEIEIRGEGIPS